MAETPDDQVWNPVSVDPVKSDGRGIDPALAELTGEAAGQQVRRGDGHMREIAPQPWGRVPEVSRADPTYYDRPMLKRSVWTVDIPLYYFLGGAAGAAMTLGAAIQLLSNFEGADPELRKLSAACHFVGIAGSTAGAAFLIHDLGRPSRFLFMMRVFRPTSPMNMGAWILAGAAPSAIATGLFINRGGLLGAIGEVCGYVSGLFGAALAGYTGVLVSNSAIPIWQEARRWMPLLFAASGASAAASIVDLTYEREEARRITQYFGTISRVTEIVAARNVEKAASAIPKVGEPFRRGRASTLWKAATALTAASVVVSLLPVDSRKKRKAAGWLGVAGSLCLRFAVHYLSDASALDPRASFQQQRAAMRAQEARADTVSQAALT
jgi:formate-dependent nitrite reductase membrane component NrfD